MQNRYCRYVITQICEKAKGKKRNVEIVMSSTNYLSAAHAHQTGQQLALVGFILIGVPGGWGMPHRDDWGTIT